MARLSVRVSDDLLHDIDASAEQLHLPRVAYVRKALERMNGVVAAQRRRALLMEASQKVRVESIRITAELEGLDGPDFNPL